ncbi:hypothetical protein PHSC3_001083 [Chlamydiales bacterium STE3]|nr:hypothetical protein PHSC3_001083 [Chlamydiales bacterium STE3]
MHVEKVNYRVDGVTCQGHLAYEDQKKRPAILIAHAWRGQEKVFQELAKKFAKEGYVGFAADVYGNARVADNNDAALSLMMPLFMDRAVLRARILAAFEQVARLPFVDQNRIAAVGFCFGGLTVIELLRSGAQVKGVVSFHGIYATHMGDQHAKIVPNAKKMHGALLVLHGNRDPLVSQEDLLNLQSEMTNAEINWELNIYSQAAHAFTNTKEHDINTGMYYEPIAASRSFKAMYSFFEEIFS